MEELTIETSYPKPAGDAMNALSEDAAPETEAALPYSESESNEGAYESEPDENEGNDATSPENVESDMDEDEESDVDDDTESGSVTDEETGSSEPYPEKPEHPVSAPETVSGNSTDYTYDNGMNAFTHTVYESDGTDSLLLIEIMERQNDILYAGFMSTLFILGTILGVLIIHGFRLRRV